MANTSSPVPGVGRKATNVSLGEALLAEAKSLRINISQAAEAGIATGRGGKAGRTLAGVQSRGPGKLECLCRATWPSAGSLPELLMARFSVYRNPEGEGYLLDIQADLLNHLNTRAVVPLLPVDIAPKPAGTLNPLFDIGETTVSMVTQFMAAVPVQMLKTSLGSLESRHGEITAAVDLLFQGF